MTPNRPILNQTAYNCFLKSVSERVFNNSNYPYYCKSHTEWESYFQKIFIKNKCSNDPIRLFIAESAPQVTNSTSNYIFDITNINTCLDPKRDMYLYRYFRGVFNSLPIQDVLKITKEEALIKLAKKNILILDLFPTHGIKLNSNERKKIVNLKPKIFDVTFLNGLNEFIYYAFSVPPCSYQNGMLKSQLDNKFKEFGNVNSGQGHAPSINEIVRFMQFN